MLTAKTLKPAESNNLVRVLIPLNLSIALQASPPHATALRGDDPEELLRAFELDAAVAETLVRRSSESAVDRLPLIYEALVHRLCAQGSGWRIRALKDERTGPASSDSRPPNSSPNNLETLREVLLPEAVTGLFGLGEDELAGRVITWLELDPEIRKERFGEVVALTRTDAKKKGRSPQALLSISKLSLILASSGVTLIVVDFHVVQALAGQKDVSRSATALAALNTLQYLPLRARRDLAPQFLAGKRLLADLIAAPATEDGDAPSVLPALKQVGERLERLVMSRVAEKLGIVWLGEPFANAFRSCWSRLVGQALAAQSHSQRVAFAHILRDGAKGSSAAGNDMGGKANGKGKAPQGAPSPSKSFKAFLDALPSADTSGASFETHPPRGSERQAGDAAEAWVAAWPSIFQAFREVLMDHEALANGLQVAESFTTWDYVDLVRFVLDEFGLQTALAVTDDDLLSVADLFVGSDRALIFSHIRDGEGPLDDSDATLEFGHRMARRHGVGHEALMPDKMRDAAYQAFPTIRYHLALEGMCVLDSVGRNENFQSDIIRTRHFSLFMITQIYRVSLLRLLTSMMREPRDANEPEVSATIERLQAQASYFARVVYHRHASSITHLEELFDSMRKTARVDSLWQSVREDLDLLAHARARVIEAERKKRQRAIDAIVSALAGAAVFGTVTGVASSLGDFIKLTSLPASWQHSGLVFLGLIVVSGALGLAGNRVKRWFVEDDGGS